ncbi:MAG: hypothetical protein U0270_20635 [Labilithrix sp.]
MRGLAVTATVALLVAACAKVDPYGDLSQDIKTESVTTAAECRAPMAGMPDVSILTACKGTKGSAGRCTPKVFLGVFADKFEQAGCKDTQVCMPETLVKNGSNVTLKKCTVRDLEGRCFWPLAKELLAKYDFLKSQTEDQCEGEQVCAPCQNPLTGEDTGICSLGEPPSPECKAKEAANPKKGGLASSLACPLEEPILDAENLPPLDCTPNMACVDKGLVGEQAAKLRPCSKGVCAPLKAILRAGNFIPKTCKAIGGAEGRCANVGIPAINEQKAILPRDICDADERCAPCFDPRTAEDTGVCHQSTCDQPKEKPKMFATCCGEGGRCVPKAAVGDAATNGTLGPDTCTGDTPICAPNPLVKVSPARPCTLLGNKGICVSDCTILGLKSRFAEMITRDCPDGELCAPCSQLPPGTDGCS